MTKKEVGALVFHLVKSHLAGQGINIESLPPDFPVSHRTLFNIKKGLWTEATLAKLPLQLTVVYDLQERLLAEANEDAVFP